MSNPLRAQIHPTVAGTIGLGGFIAGVLDITDAIVFYYFRGVSPITILQSIASVIFAHIVCVGWPIALAAQYSARVPTVPRPGHV